MSILINKDFYDKLFLVVFLLSGFVLNGFLGYHYFLFYFVFLSVIYFVLLKITIKSNIILLYLSCVFLSWSLSYYFPKPYNLFIEILSVIIMIYAMDKKEDLSFIFFLKNLFYFTAFFVFLNYLLAKYLNISFIFTSRNQNYEAFFYLITFSFLIREKPNLFRIFFILLITFLILLIKSRIGLISIALLMIIRIYRYRDRYNIFFVVLLILLFILLFINYGDILKLGDPKSYKRFEMYLTSIKAFLSSPFIGWGVGSFEYVFEIFKFPYHDGVSFYGHSLMHPHSHLLNMLVEGGILLGFVIVFILYSAIKNRLDYTIIALLPFLLFDSIFFNPFIRIIFFLFVGLNLNTDNMNLEIKRILPFFMIILIPVFSFKNSNDLKIYYNSYSEIFNSQNVFRVSAISQYSYFHNPKNTVFLYLYSYLKRDRKDALEKIVSLEPNFTQAQIELCDLYFKLKDKRFPLCVNKIRFNNNCNQNNIYSFFFCNYNQELYNNLKKNLNNY